MEKSEYYKSLTGDVALRYAKKIEVIGDLDPYTLKENDFNNNVECLPHVSLVDLVAYFIYSHSYYTTIQLKSYKALDAYKYYESGLVQCLLVKQVDETYLVMGQVKHSQRLREKPLEVWAIVLRDGSISSGHCVCMAGLGEVCSHVAAVLFALHDQTIPEDEVSCTEKLALWPVPSTSNVEMERIQDIYSIPSSTTKTSSLKAPPLEGEELVAMLQKIEETGISTPICRVMEPFASRTPQTTSENLPASLDSLYNEEYCHKTYDELLSICNSISLTISREEIKLIENVTREQHLSNSWFRFRAGRVTASKLKAVCHTTIAKPSLSLIKGICYPQRFIFRSKQTLYGIRHEKDALAQYQQYISAQNHTDLSVSSCGFYISAVCPQLGASPDGRVSCECCGMGCVEIKCPYLLSDNEVSLIDYASRRWTCLVKEAETFHLDRSHSYFYQIQMQMFVTDTTYCDFIVWSKKEMFMERVLFDSEFCVDKINQAQDFHKYVIKPELVGRYFTSPNRKVSLWCFCQESDDGRPMLECENDNCQLKWFHLDCVQLTEVPDEVWFCADCA